MPKDPILERLGRERDAARERQQSAYDDKKRAEDTWRQANDVTANAYERKTSSQKVTSQAFQKTNEAQARQNALYEHKKTAQDATTRAFERKKSAQASFSAARESVQSQRDRLSASADAYRRSASGHFAQATDYSNSARNAYDKYSRASFIQSARHERELGHAENQRARRCMDEIRSLGSSLSGPRATLENAKADFDAAKRVSDPLKAEFDAARNATLAARAERDRLKVRSDTDKASFDAAKRMSDQAKAKRDAARTAFTEAQKATLSAKTAFDARLTEVREKRRPKDSSLIQRLAEQVLAETGIIAQGEKRVVQYEDGDVRVTVRYDYNRSLRMRVTDILLYDRNNHDQHYHHVVDENGHVILSEWRQNLGR